MCEYVYGFIYVCLRGDSKSFALDKFYFLFALLIAGMKWDELELLAGARAHLQYILFYFILQCKYFDLNDLNVISVFAPLLGETFQITCQI